MVDEVVISVTDLEKKHPGKSGYEGMYSFVKHIYQDDGEIVTDGFALDKDNLILLRAKIMAILIDDLHTTKINNNKESNRPK